MRLNEEVSVLTGDIANTKAGSSCLPAQEVAPDQYACNSRLTVAGSTGPNRSCIWPGGCQ